MNEVPPIGARVRRRNPYKEVHRALTGTVVRHYTAPNGDGQVTHAIVDYDDGMTSKVHPSALALIAPPRSVPVFASVEEADAWLEAQAEPPCLHLNVFTVFNAGEGMCESCRATVQLDERYVHLGGDNAR